MADQRQLLHDAALQIMQNDEELANKARALLGNDEVRPVLERMSSAMGMARDLEGFAGLDSELALETIVARAGRPVLRVQNDDYRVEGPEAAIWESRLNEASIRSAIRSVIPAVGRIEVDNHPQLDWIGTGWLIGDDVIVTNRHVAEEFCARSEDGFLFRRGWPDRQQRMQARIDFKEESETSQADEFPVLDILHIEEPDGPDIAFFRLSRSSTSGKTLSKPLRLAGQAGSEKQFVATVGYPAADSRVPDQDLVLRLFGDVYNVKRLAPGQILRLRDGLVLHDCSTLGGNSGSPIFDIQTGEVVGLHFSGLFLEENRGVPAAVVSDRVSKLQRGTLHRVTRDKELPKTAVADSGPSSTGSSVARFEVTVPIELTINIGSPRVGQTQSVVASAATSDLTRTIDEAVAEARATLGSRPDVLAVRNGYVFRDGWITDEQAVVVVLRDAEAVQRGDHRIPAAVAGHRIEVRAPGPWDIVEAQELVEALEGFPRTTYEPPEGVSLTPVEEKMRLICHACPDAGWPVLKDFLAGTKERLTIGMYDFTAPHIVDGVLSAVKNQPRLLSLVLQAKASLGSGTKKDDIPEEETMEDYENKLHNRLDFAWASVGKNHRFASAYHIKVAVRDGKSFWLSSGNWQSSNQPKSEIAAGNPSWDLLMNHNREWNVVVENENLASQFEVFLKHDLKQAHDDEQVEAVEAVPEFLVEEAILERVPPGTPTYFPPLIIDRKVRVRPLLTPDNYQKQVLDLIESADEQVLFQNQSFSILDKGNNDARYTQLYEALLAKQRAGIDVRIIIRGEFDAEKYLEQLKKTGFDTGRVRLQDRCHTKGIIVDRKRVLLGSHNWTNQGTLVNRDASLIFDDREIAEYFAEIFWFDWKNLARQSILRRRRVRIDDGTESIDGMIRIPWHALLED